MAAAVDGLDLRHDHDVGNQQPLVFVRLTDLAQQLPARQLNALIGLLRFCWRTPRCWPSQKTLAEIRRCSVGKINLGLRELVAAGVIAKGYQHIGRENTCIYEIAPGYWLPTAQKVSISAGNSRSRTEIDSTLKKKTPPVAPRDAGGSAPDLDHQVVADAGIEGEAIEGASSAASEDDRRPPPPRSSTRCTPYGQPRAPRRPRARRQRQIKASLAQTIMDIAHRDDTATAEPAARPALPPPPDIIPPGHQLVAGEVIPMPRQAAPRPRGFSPATNFWEAMKHVAGMSETPDRAGCDDAPGAHWQSDEGPEVQQMIGAAWLSSLVQFDAEVVIASCREWWENQTRRPVLAEIVKLCRENQDNTNWRAGRTLPKPGVMPEAEQMQQVDIWARNRGFASMAEMQRSPDFRGASIKVGPRQWRRFDPIREAEPAVERAAA